MNETNLAAPEGAIDHGVNFLTEGGVFMIPIVLCSLVAVTIIVQRLLFLRRPLLIPHRLEAVLRRLQAGPDPEGLATLAALAAVDPSPLGRILDAAFQRRDFGRDGLQIGVEAVAREEVGKMQSGLAILEVIITIAPLIGLLGTLSGLIAVFGGLGSSNGLQGPDPTVIAAGISEALFTTVGGLVVAVPVVIAHSWLNRHIERIASRLEVLASIVFAALQAERHPPGGAPFAAAASSSPRHP
ncbi:MAG: MotA/TolQ/ExbB proton channel family protein [Verrucomicrobia bacterium]|nr:MotA/TolQ/ExbB proton channel family protein [Verrucomicrobiota bacterium]